jgi:hypothetical protein
MLNWQHGRALFLPTDDWKRTTDNHIYRRHTPPRRRRNKKRAIVGASLCVRVQMIDYWVSSS